MAIITSTIDGTIFYTVKNSSFPISDVRTMKAVSDFGALASSLAVVEDKLTLSEKPFKSPNKKVLETANTTEKITKSSVKKTLEIIGLDEERSGFGSKKIIENITIIEKPIKKFFTKNLEGFAVIDNTHRALNINKTENLNFVDIFGKDGQFFLLFTENDLRISEKKFKSANKKILETANITERIVKSPIKNMFGIIRLDDRRINTNTKNIMEVFIFLDDKCIKKLNRPVEEYFGLSSSFLKEIELNKIESLNVAEIFGRIADFNVWLRENMTVITQTNKNVTINRSELLVLFSTMIKFFDVLKKESTGIDEKLSNKSVFKRTFAETIYNTSKIFKTFNLSHKEFMEIAEAYVRHANAVISDISLGLGELSLEEFLNKTSSPPGYDKFIEFIVGEYKYQDALVRMFIEAGAAKSEPLIYDMVVNVDIDDTVDRGTAQITDTSAPTMIRFNKHYYHPPEVGVTVKGGTGTSVIAAEIVEIREDGFYVSLYNSSRARVIGTITWTAVGY